MILLLCTKFSCLYIFDGCLEKAEKGAKVDPFYFPVCVFSPIFIPDDSSSCFYCRLFICCHISSDPVSESEFEVILRWGGISHSINILSTITETRMSYSIYDDLPLAGYIMGNKNISCLD